MYNIMMPGNRYILHALKYSMLTVVVLSVVGGGFAVMNNAANDSLQGRLVSPQQRGETPVVHYSSQDIAERGGVNLPSDTHVIFAVPRGARQLLMTFFGGPDINATVRFWVYCYSGNEDSNKAADKTGRQLYDGRFYFSDAELTAQNPPKAAATDLVSVLHRAASDPEQARSRGSEISYFEGGETCYAMIDGQTAAKVGAGVYASLDTDGDGIPDLREQHLSTDPHSADTDGDRIDDGRELFTSKTDPKRADTDRDGLSDVLEDKNADGQLDPDETSSLTSDTDRDGLCDGDGLLSGCPEERREICEDRDHCHVQMTSPVYGEDMNQNGVVDQGETDPREDSTFPPQTDFEYKFQHQK